MVSVNLVQSLCLPSGKRAVIEMQLNGEYSGKILLLEPDQQTESETGVQVSGALIKPAVGGRAKLVVSNLLGFTQKVPTATKVGEDSEVVLASIVKSDAADDPVSPTSTMPEGCEVRRVDTGRALDPASRQQRSKELVGKLDLLDEEQTKRLQFACSMPRL